MSYIKEENTDPDTREGWPERGRPASMATDLDKTLARPARSLYAVTSYNVRKPFDHLAPCRKNDDDKTVWRTSALQPVYVGDREKNTPRHTDHRAISAWVDLDLAADLGDRRGTRRLLPEDREVMERVLVIFAEALADLLGSWDAVFLLDSVGGVYAMSAPAATLPIAEHHADDADARARIFDEFVTRSNDWLEHEVHARAVEAVPRAGEVTDPDFMNNRNRQYKAPLTVHKDHSAVVTPLNPADPDYTVTPFDAVSDELIAEAEA